MKTLLDDCRRLIGDPPRRFSILDWGYLHFERPNYARDAERGEFDGDSSLLAGVRFERDQELLRRHGRVVWGWLVHANSEVFAPGLSDHGGAVVYCEGPEFEDAPWPLAEVAEGLKEPALRPADAGVQAIGEVLDHEMKSLGDVPVPPVLAGAHDVRCADLFIHRRHLPDGVLVGGLLPVLAARDHTAGAVVLPARFWPEDLVAFWVTGRVAALRPSVQAAVKASLEERP